MPYVQTKWARVCIDGRLLHTAESVQRGLLALRVLLQGCKQQVHSWDADVPSSSQPLSAVALTQFHKHVKLELLRRLEEGRNPTLLSRSTQCKSRHCKVCMIEHCEDMQVMHAATLTGASYAKMQVQA